MEYLFHANDELQGKKVIIYGLDSQGKKLFHALLQLNIRVEAFCARKNQDAGNLDQVFGKRVLRFPELGQLDGDGACIVVSGFSAHHDVGDLKEIGIRNIVVENITSNDGILLDEDAWSNRAILGSNRRLQIEQGGISISTRYDTEKQVLMVRGWYLPVQAYDAVQIFAGEQYLGNAQLHCRREDVYKSLPQYGEHRSGWIMGKRIALPLPCTIMAKCLKNGTVMKTSRMVLEKSESITEAEMHGIPQESEWRKRFRAWIPRTEDFLGGQEFEDAMPWKQERILLEHCCDLDRNFLPLSSGGIFFHSLNGLHTILGEILFHEDYWFASSREDPLIVDGGANIGLATYYFKHLYPKAQVLAFEPDPELAGIFRRNAEYNHWEGVTLYPCALSNLEGEAVFYRQPADLAGSLERRNFEGVNETLIREVHVPTVRLGKYLQQHVDYLKLDIEGIETKVMEDIEDLLKNVEHVFIEFHDGAMKGHNYISKVLGILEGQGFDVMVRHQKDEKPFRAMRWIGKRISEVIWAKKRKP